MVDYRPKQRMFIMAPTRTPRHPALAPLTLALALGLAACNGGSNGGSNGGGSGGTPTAVTVSPALGVVKEADVRLLALDGSELASGHMDASGSVTLPEADLDGGFIVEMSGNASASYFDEGANAWRALPAGSVLHAASADGRGDVAVTALTEIAYRRAQQLAGGGTLTAAAITQANDELAAWLARVPVSIATDGSQVLPDTAPDILAPATPVGGAVQLSSSNAAGRYAILLATLSQQAFAGAMENADPCVANVDCSPLLPVIAQLATDFADGVLDNKNPHGGSQGLPFIDPAVSPVDVLDPAAPREDLTPQEEIGREFPGTHTLTCDGYGEPATLAIQDNGAMALSGPLGSYSLPFDDVSNQVGPFVQHTYRLTPTGKAFVARLRHLDGSSLVDDLRINAHVDGSVQVIKGAATTNCHTSFTHGEAQPGIPYFTNILVGTHFYCLTNSSEGVVQVTVDWTPTTWSINGIVQPEQYGNVTQYSHFMFKQASLLFGAVKVNTYEQYHWGQEATSGFVGLSRAQLRYQGYPQFTVYDMASGPYNQGPGNCYPQAQEWYPMATGEGSIMINFGDRVLTL